MATWRRWAFRVGLAGVGLFSGGLVLMSTVPQAAWLLGVGLLLAFAGTAVAVRRAVCPRCGRPLYMVAVNLSHCPACGSPLPPDGQDAEPPEAPDRWDT
jgi:hypothetical protein